jgi:hypothetical protein
MPWPYSFASLVLCQAQPGIPACWPYFQSTMGARLLLAQASAPVALPETLHQAPPLYLAHLHLSFRIQFRLTLVIQVTDIY